MKRILTLTLAVCLFTAAASAAPIEGAWTAARDEKRPGKLYFQLTQGRHSNIGTTMALADFANLAQSQVDAATMTPVNFQLRREAGNAAFEGTFRNGKGAGQFTFTPNPAYLDAIRALGVTNDLDCDGRGKHRERDQDDCLFSLALHDVSTAFIKSMQAEGYRVGLEKYLTMRIFDITPDYIREMRSLGFKNLDADDLVGAKIHKVTPDYVRRMRAAGWNLDLEELQASSIHKATPEFAAEMKKLGYGNLKFDDLVAFRIHKVTAEFIAELKTLGYTNIDADDLVAMRIHKVTPTFIRELQAAGYKNVPVEKLVSMKIHKIDAKMLKALNGKG